MIDYNFLMTLTNSLSDISSKLGSSFYVFQTMFLTVNFLQPTENLIQCPFQQAGILFFGSWCFCIISKRSYVLNNFRNYFHAKAFQKPLTILFNNFFLCLLRLLPYFLIISFFLICVYYVLSVLHASYLYVCFVNISAYIPTEIPTRLSNLFYTNSFIFIFVDVNVDVEYAIHSDLVICNNFINYKVLPAFDFHSICLEPSQLLQTDLTPERKCCNDYCFCLILFIFSIMFARVFLRSKHKRVKAFFGCILSLLTIVKSNLLTKNDILMSTSEIFTKFKYRNKDSFFKLLLFFSADIILNPGPSHINQTSDNNEWDVFKARGLHFIHININSLLPKIEELRRIACQSKAAVIGISESKLDNSIFDSEIEIDGYNILRFDRNRHGGGVACYVRNDLSFTKRNYFPHDIETIFIEIFLPKTKPMTVGIVYRPPSQTSFLETMNEHFYKLDTINKETYILGDFNINLYLNNKYVFEKCSTIVSNTIPYDVRKYQEFCNVFNLKQLISCPTRITCSSSTIIDHILASYPDRVSQKGIIDIGISDHQLIFCTRKTLKTNTASHKQISF